MTTTECTSETSVDPTQVLTPDTINAAFHLTQVRQAHPELDTAERHAAHMLAQAIMDLDDAEERAQIRFEATGERRHTLFEQAKVEEMTRKHTYALADLLRGYAGSSVGNSPSDKK